MAGDGGGGGQEVTGDAAHLARHGVSLTECEEALHDPLRAPAPAYPGPTGEPRWAIIGATGNGRVLRVVYTLRWHSREAAYRIVTAHPASPSQRRRYPAAVPEADAEEESDD